MEEYKRESCVVKEIEDVFWFDDDFVDGLHLTDEIETFVFHSESGNKKAFRHDVMHDADYCIVVNTSHTKIALLDFSTLKYNAYRKWFAIKASKVLNRRK